MPVSERNPRVSRHINAPRERVYNALVDPKAIVKPPSQKSGGRKETPAANV